MKPEYAARLLSRILLGKRRAGRSGEILRMTISLATTSQMVSSRFRSKFNTFDAMEAAIRVYIFMRPLRIRGDGGAL